MKARAALRAVLAAFLGAASAAQGAPVPIPPGAVHGRFVQSKKIAGLSLPLVSRGTFALLPGKGLVWRTATPMPDRVVLTPRGVFALGRGGPRRLAPGGTALTLMREILEGDTKALARLFVVRRTGTNAAWTMVLTPRPGPVAELFGPIRVAGGRFVLRAVLQERSGDETVLRFRDMRAGPGPLRPDEEALLGP